MATPGQAPLANAASATVPPTPALLLAMLQVSSHVSDLIFSPGSHPHVEVSGQLVPVRIPGLPVLGPTDTERIAQELIGDNKQARAALQSLGSCDISYSLPGTARFRVNVFVQRGSHAIVMRVIPKSIPTFDELKLPKELAHIADIKNGIVLVTGPTGSGKTVSLYTGLNILNKEDTNISTAEDPAEINLPGVNQVNVNNKVGLTFAAALRAFLRQDPDVVMVGEIRDLETAEIAIKAAQTGHLVMSTLHTNDAPQTMTRLVDMGVKPYAIATSVSLIIAQRLARRLCSQCKAVVDVPAEALLKEGFQEADVRAGMKIYGPKGCSNCSDGYKGRCGIYQVMPVTEAIGRIIMEGGNAIDISDQAKKEGVWDLRRAGLEKVKQGLTSIEEINSVTIE